MKDGAMTYRANLNMNGGGSTARYFISMSYVQEGGMFKTDDTLKKSMIPTVTPIHGTTV